MWFERQLVRSLVAAIVMIAAYLAPSGAEAHAGHHPSTPAAVSAPGAVAPTSTGLRADAGKATVVADAEPTRVAAPARSEPSSPLQGCTGACCGTGAACCAHALVADGSGPAPTGAASRRSLIPDDLGRPGVIAEALPEPPKTFA